MDADDVWAEPELKAALRAAFAVRGDRQPRWALSANPSVSMWAVPHIGRPSSPILLGQHHGFMSMSFTSLTAHSWVNDMASLTAMAIGYGFTMTRDLAVEVTGLPHDQTPEAERRDIHAALLSRPPHRRVWSHHAPLGKINSNPFAPLGREAAQGLLHVRVRESDRLLEFAEEQGEASGDLRVHRDRIDTLVAAMPAERVISLDIDYHDTNAERWTEVLRGVHTVLCELKDRQALSELRHVHDRLQARSPKVVGPLLRWLRHERCAAVA